MWGWTLLLARAGSLKGWELALCLSFPSCERGEPKLRAENAQEEVLVKYWGWREQDRAPTRQTGGMLRGLG